MDTLPDFGHGVNILDVHENLADHIRHRRHFRLFHTASGDRRRSQPDAASLKGRARLKWDRILVRGDACFIKDNLTVQVPVKKKSRTQNT